MHEGALTFICLRDGVEWSGEGYSQLYRDHEGSTFQRHRGRVPFDIEKHNSMEIASLQTFDKIHGNQTAKREKFGLGGFDLKLFRLVKIDGKAENFAIVTKTQLEMELPFLIGSATSGLSLNQNKSNCQRIPDQV